MNTRDVVMTANRRLQILKALALRPRYCAAPRDMLGELEATGYPMRMEKLMIDTAYLADLGLVSAPDYGVLQLTDDGLEVARGLIRLPGIGTPTPGEL